MSSDDNTRSLPDVRFRAPGTGHFSLWICPGCNLARATLGSKGASGSIKRRCAACVAAKAGGGTTR